MSKVDRSISNSILRVMLKEFSKEELIANLIATINNICDDEKSLKEVRHLIITYAHVRKIVLGKSKLEDYEEPYRSKLKKAIEKLR